MSKPIDIDPEFEKLLNPLAAEEFAELEKQILKEGCRHALVVWQEKNLLIDGHNRYKICKKHGKPYRPHLMSFKSREDVILWIITNQLARRNLSDFDRGKIVLKQKEIIASRGKPGTRTDLSSNLTKGSGLDTRNELAKMAGISTGSLTKVEKIEANAVPAVNDAVSNGDISIDAAATLASLPKEEQDKLAAQGVQAMKAAAKAKRDAKKVKPAKAKSPIPEIKEEAQISPAADTTNDDDTTLDTESSDTVDAPLQSEFLPPPTGDAAAVTDSVNADNLPKVQTQEEDYRRLSEDLQVQLDQCRKEHDLVLKENAALRSENQALQLKLEALRLQLQTPQEDVACVTA